MAFDGITTKNILIELNNNLINARIEKIYVPTKNDIFLCFHTKNRDNLKLLISIDANNARIHFSNSMKENPSKAPQICMILRKHLQGAKLLSISQYGLDRVITFKFENINELGDLVQKSLVVELMGKYSNVILIDDKEKIIDSMRHVDITMSSIREVLPNKNYILPTTLGKKNFTALSFAEFSETLINSDSLDLPSAISNNLIGFSKSFVNSFLKELQLSNADVSRENLKIIYDKLIDVFKTMENASFNFKMTENEKDYHLDINDICKENLALSTFLDEYYSKKESVSLIKNAKMNIEHDVNSHISKLSKKLANVNEILLDIENLEKYKQFGELLNCNMHNLSIGMDKIEVINFYDNNNLITIPLQKNLTPSRNAQNYFKKYNKLKNSIVHATAYKKEFETDIDYLNSVVCELELAESLKEIDEIREELVSCGYIKKAYKSNKKRDDLPSEPIKYEYNGITILVGRNNVQNDKLTFKIAKKTDMWLHTKKIHGSHVIIRSDNVPDDVLLYAAKLAVMHSAGKNSSKVEVDYTQVKFVHKEAGAKPGMVVYTDYHTVIV